MAAMPSFGFAISRLLPFFLLFFELRDLLEHDLATLKKKVNQFHSNRFPLVPCAHRLNRPSRRRNLTVVQRPKIAKRKVSALKQGKYPKWSKLRKHKSLLWIAPSTHSGV